jgi:hypothetical protein
VSSKKEFAVGQHVGLSGRIVVIRTPFSTQHGGSYEIKPLHPRSLADSMPARVQAWMLDALTEGRLCRHRTAENFCTCGAIHVSREYAIAAGR